MIKRQSLSRKAALTSSILLISTAILAGCVSSFKPGEPLRPADAMKAGPGVFSGSSGVFDIVGGESKVAKATSLKGVDMNEASTLIEEKIQQLEQQQKELEDLKRQVERQLK